MNSWCNESRQHEEEKNTAETDGSYTWQVSLLVYLGEDGHVAAVRGEVKEEEYAQPDCLLLGTHLVI